MAKNSVAQFFASVYNDKSLQGALHYALAKSAPAVVVDIAKKKGFEFTGDELNAALQGSGELSEAELSGAVGGAAMSAMTLSQVSLQRNFWGGIGGLGKGGGFASGFELTIPGPSFVNVMTSETRDASEADGAPETTSVSAADVYAGLLGD